jgi:hypothetical protein
MTFATSARPLIGWVCLTLALAARPAAADLPAPAAQTTTGAAAVAPVPVAAGELRSAAWVFTAGDPVVRLVVARPKGFTTADEGPKTHVSVDAKPSADADVLRYDGAHVVNVVGADTEVAAQKSVVYRVILLVDRSLSMATGLSNDPTCKGPDGGTCSWWHEAAHALEAVLKALPDAVTIEATVAPFDCRFTRKGEFKFQSPQALLSSLGPILTYPSVGSDPDAKKKTLCTTLYNAIAEAHQEAVGDPDPQHKYQIVVVSDGVNDLRDEEGTAYKYKDDGTVMRYGDGTPMTTTLYKYRPWCDPANPWPTSHPWGWIAEYRDDRTEDDNDGAQKTCTGSDASTPSPLPQQTSFGDFKATVAKATQGKDPAVPLACFGFHGAADPAALNGLCTSTGYASDSAGLVGGVVAAISSRVNTLGITVRFPGGSHDALSGKPVRVTFVDGTAIDGLMPRDFVVGTNAMQCLADEKIFCTPPPPPVAQLVIAFSVLFGLCVSVWLVVPRLLWREMEGGGEE